jgi:hypothetical protein
MLSFGLAWIVGVWCRHSPAVRVESALLALLAGCVAGAGIGCALEKIVLARLAESWDGQERAPSAGAPASPRTDAAASAPRRAAGEAAAPEPAEAAR